MKEYLEKDQIMPIIENTLYLTDDEYDALWKNIKAADSVAFEEDKSTFDEDESDDTKSKVAHWVGSTESVGCKSLGTIEVPTYTCTHCGATVGSTSISPFCPECGYFMIIPDGVSFLDDDGDDDHDYYTTNTLEDEVEIDINLEKKETYTLEEILDAIAEIWNNADTYTDTDIELNQIKNYDEDKNDDCSPNEASDDLSIPFVFKTLYDTVSFMNSSSYKDRMIAEYHQTKIRYNRLVDMLKKWDDNELDFIPSCPRSLLEFQASAMKNYLMVLESRASIEGIVLDLD